MAWIKERGVDISPFKENMASYYVPERFFASDVDFGCIVATAKGHDGIYVTKDMMKYLLLAAGGRGGISTGGGGSNNELTNWDGTKKKNGWGVS